MALRASLIAAFSLVFLSAGAFAAPPAAEFRNGRWQPVTTPPKAPVSDPDLDRVELMLAGGQVNEAVKLDIYWIHSHSSSAPLRDRAIYLLGEGKYHSDDWISAFYYFDEVMEEYPESRLFYPALEKQYQIADGFLKGHKRKFLGLPIVSGNEEAVEMLYRIQQRSPGSPLAEKALLRTADFYYSNADYDLAHDAYGFYVKNYPRSPMVPQVRLRQAFSALAQFRGLLYDPTNMLDARAELSEILSAYPALAADENVTAVVNSIDQTLAAKLYQTADYYRRTHNLRGATYMYRYLVVTYPDASQIPAAKKALETMPQYALDQPAPLPGTQYFPPVAPAGNGTPEQ